MSALPVNRRNRTGAWGVGFGRRTHRGPGVRFECGGGGRPTMTERWFAVAVIVTLACAPSAAGAGDPGGSVVLADVKEVLKLASDAMSTDIEKIFIGVPADSGPARHAIEKTGFSYEFSAYERTRFCRRRRWIDGALTPKAQTQSMT